MRTSDRKRTARIIYLLLSVAWIGLIILMAAVSAVTQRELSPLWQLPAGVLILLFGISSIYFKIEFTEIYQAWYERYPALLKAFTIRPMPVLTMLFGAAAVVFGILFIIFAVKAFF